MSQQARPLHLAHRLKPGDFCGFLHASRADRTRQSGHLSELSYMADRAEEHASIRHRKRQINDSPEVPDEKFQAFGTPQVCRAAEG